jgi:hypothetical protein
MMKRTTVLAAAFAALVMAGGAQAADHEVKMLNKGEKGAVAWQLTARMRSIPCSFPFNHENLIDVVLKLTASVRRTGVYQPVRSVSRRRR